MRGVSRPYNETHKAINDVVYKLCSDCDEWLPLNESYYKNKTAPDGHNPYCKDCTKKRTMERYNNNTEKIKIQMSEYMKKERRINPERRQKERDFSKSQKESGYYKDYQKKNMDYFVNYQKYRNSNKKHEISEDEWIACKKYFNNSCAYCGLHIDDHYIVYGGELKHTDLHKEHVTHNGSNTIDNCVPACSKCNSSKWTFELADWYTPYNEIYNVERLLRIIKWIEDDYKLIKQ